MGTMSDKKKKIEEKEKKKRNELNEKKEMNEKKEKKRINELNEKKKMNELNEKKEMNELNEKKEMNELNEKKKMNEKNEKKEMSKEKESKNKRDKNEKEKIKIKIKQKNKEFTEKLNKEPENYLHLTKEEIEHYRNIIENFNYEDKEVKEILKDYKEPPEGFDKIGFTRPLGGFFYEFFYALVVGIAVALTFALVLKVLYPYPDSKAYSSVGNILFSFLFFIMNIPTEFSLEIFVAKYRVKDPLKMIQFLRFYIWYQMLTGVLLITATSIYVLYILNTGNLVYTKWLLLVYISREYPAMTGVFGATLKGFQRFDYQTKLNYFGQIIQPLTEVIFVLWGRYWLGNNPMFGELMGIAIGYAIGTYVDDFITMALGMFYLNRVLKPMGFSIKDCIIPSVEKAVWKESVIFGLKLSPPGFLGSLLGFFAFFWWYDLVPAYATFLVLNETADKVANIIRRGGGIYLKGTMSEALSNGKKKLAAYYVMYALKFSFMTMMALAVILYSLLPTLTRLMFATGGIEAWILAIAFVPPNMLESTSEQLLSISNDTILGAQKATFYSVMQIANTIFQFALDWFLLFILQWPQNASIIALVWIIALKDFPTKLLRLAINFWFIQKKIIKLHIKEFYWQTWIAGIPPMIIVALIAKFWENFIYPSMETILGLYVAEGITIFGGFLMLLWVFFPLYTIFGGWDNYSIEIFSNAVEISGPSKFLFRPVVKANNLFKRSPLHNKYPIPWKEADREADELMRERFVKDVLVKRLENSGVIDII